MIIKLINITKKYKNIKALDDINCEINEGEFVSFIGPSGSGKSTILNIISGIIPQTSGMVFFENQEISKLNPKDRNIGFVFQNYSLYPSMTVSKNIEFPLECNKINKKERMKRVNEIAELVKIKHLLEKKPNELSGGEQQRVAIARALVKKPKLLLLDEPFSNLDPRLSADLRVEIRKLQLKLKITTILVTHNQAEAMELSDKIGILSAGKLIQFNTPKNVYMEPNCIFSAQFLGDVKINSVEGYVKNEVFYSNNEYFKIDAKNISDGAITLCFRPEVVQIESGDFQFNAEVVSIYNHGKEYVIVTNCGENEIKFFINSNKLIPSINEKIILGLKLENIMFFDSLDGKSKVMVYE